MCLVPWMAHYNCISRMAESKKVGGRRRKTDCTRMARGVRFKIFLCSLRQLVKALLVTYSTDDVLPFWSPLLCDEYAD